MSIYKYIISSMISTLSVSNIIEHKMNVSNSSIKKPVDTVSIIIPSYNEEQFIEKSLLSLRNQSIVDKYPSMFEYILVDSQSTDNTVKLAEQFIDKIIISPRGKLTARNLGTYQSHNNIIVSTDADTIYPYNWLNNLLEPFNNSKVIGVVGSTYDDSIPNVPKAAYLLASTLDRYIIHPYQMVGRNSAYYKHLFYLTGKFNTTINQQDIKQMLNEEEIEFGNRLSKYGDIIFQLNASCIHLGGQKIGCRLGTTDKNICNNYGIKIERFG